MLKTYISFLIFVLVIGVASAQVSVATRYSIKLDTVSVRKYEKEKSSDKSFKTIYLQVAYGRFELENLKEAEVLNNATIKSIDLVYTQYPVDEDFSLLNQRRIEYLHLACPSIFNNTMTSWRIVAQTACKNEATASSMYHGFVVTYKPGPTAESARDERAYIKKVIEGKASLEDSTIFKIFRRNKWKDMTVVTDFTGSMSPYFVQVYLWYELTFATRDFHEFVFFNDGDLTPDDKKRTGKTGGIYYCNSTNRDTVLGTAFRCSTNGFGGDIQENNIEAALYAVKKNPKLKEIVMIVDNWAPMRDYSMIRELKVPVHVLVCGSSETVPVNPEYLDLAFNTKGSVHTLQDDINNMTKLAEGSKITIGKFQYMIRGGKFIKITGA